MLGGVKGLIEADLQGGIYLQDVQRIKEGIQRARDNQVDIRIYNSDGSLLHRVVERALLQNADIAKLKEIFMDLVAAGVDPYAQNSSGMNPFQFLDMLIAQNPGLPAQQLANLRQALQQGFQQQAQPTPAPMPQQAVQQRDPRDVTPAVQKEIDIFMSAINNAKTAQDITALRKVLVGQQQWVQNLERKGFWVDPQVRGVLFNPQESLQQALNQREDQIRRAQPMAVGAPAQSGSPQQSDPPQQAQVAQAQMNFLNEMQMEIKNIQALEKKIAENIREKKESPTEKRSRDQKIQKVVDLFMQDVPCCNYLVSKLSNPEIVTLEILIKLREALKDFKGTQTPNGRIYSQIQQQIDVRFRNRGNVVQPARADVLRSPNQTFTPGATQAKANAQAKPRAQVQGVYKYPDNVRHFDFSKAIGVAIENVDKKTKEELRKVDESTKMFPHEKARAVYNVIKEAAEAGKPWAQKVLADQNITPLPPPATHHRFNNK